MAEPPKTPGGAPRSPPRPGQCRGDTQIPSQAGQTHAKWNLPPQSHLPKSPTRTPHRPPKRSPSLGAISSAFKDPTPGASFFKTPTITGQSQPPAPPRAPSPTPKQTPHPPRVAGGVPTGTPPRWGRLMGSGTRRGGVSRTKGKRGRGARAPPVDPTALRAAAAVFLACCCSTELREGEHGARSVPGTKGTATNPPLLSPNGWGWGWGVPISPCAAGGS